MINANNLPKQAKSSTDIIKVYTHQKAFKVLSELARTYFPSFMPQLYAATAIAKAKDHPVFSFFLPYTRCPLLEMPLSSSSSSSSQNLTPLLKSKLKHHQHCEDISNTTTKMNSLLTFWDMTVCVTLACWTPCVAESLTVISTYRPPNLTTSLCFYVNMSEQLQIDIDIFSSITFL